MKDVDRAASCYLILDNGGNYYRACFNSRRFWVTLTRGKGDVVVPPTAYSRVFVGNSPGNAALNGNSTLFELPSSKNGKKKYVFVGVVVCSFFASVPIQRFVSPVGNSGVPFPYAVDKDGGVYFFDLISVTVMTVTLMSRPTEKIARAVEKGEDPYAGFEEFRKKTGYRNDAGLRYDRMTPAGKARAAPSRAEYVKKIRRIGAALGVSEVRISTIAGRIVHSFSK